MGLFGGGARALKRRIQRDLTTASWQVLAGGNTWICPFCVTPAIKRYPDDEEGRQEAVLQHLDAACPEFRAGEGEERPLAELRRTAIARELRAKVKSALVNSTSWQLIDIKRAWYCPYCATAANIEIPADRRMTEQILQQVIEHIDRCYAYDHGRGEEKPLKKLKKAVKKANKTRKLIESVRRKLEGEPGWRRKDKNNCWVCPYCLKTQDRIDLSSTLLMFENAPRLIAAHLLDSCKEYRSGAKPKPLNGKKRASERLEHSAGLGSGTETGPLLDDPSGPLGLESTGPARSPFESSGSADLERPTSRTGHQERGSGRLPGWSDMGDALGLPDDVDLPPPDEEVVLPPWDEEETGDQGTTLKELRTKGEYVQIDESDERALSSKTQSRALAWRQEIERELATVRGLAPLSGEIHNAYSPQTASDPRQAQRQAELERRGLELKILTLPASKPRGDFAEVLELGNGRLGLAVGGLATEEPEGPLVAALARDLIHKKASHDRCPREVLKDVNRDLFPDLDGRNFFTCAYAILDVPTSRIQVCRAGLAPPLLMNVARGPAARQVEGEGMMMGIDRGPIFTGSLDLRSIQLQPGDMLVMFSNGIIEARAVGREEFGLQRMEQLVSRYARHEVEYFIDKFEESFQGFHAPPSRRLVDACVIGLKRHVSP